MKKLLVLMLALGMASAANAIVVQLSFNGATDGANETTVGTSNTYTIPISTNFVIDVKSDTDDVTYRMLVRVYDVGNPYGTCDDVNGFDVAHSVIYGVGHAAGAHTDGGDAGDDATVTASTVPNSLLVDALDSASPFNITAGTHFEFYLHCNDESDVYVDLTDESLVVVDRILIHQIPEPMTVALLGLGGLFLRRRR